MLDNFSSKLRFVFFFLSNVSNTKIAVSHWNDKICQLHYFPSVPSRYPSPNLMVIPSPYEVSILHKKSIPFLNKHPITKKYLGKKSQTTSFYYLLI